MDPIKETFEAYPLSIAKVFKYSMGTTGFRVPIYQRSFRWPISSIFRLLEDISQGINTLQTTNGEQTLTFLGTIILVDDNTGKDDEFPGNSMAIVDGQQRLTTLAITLSQIHYNLMIYYNYLDDNNDIDIWIKDEIGHLRWELFFSFITAEFHQIHYNPYQYIPSIVRSDCDNRSRSYTSANYTSPIATYLFNYAKYVWNHVYGESNNIHSFEAKLNENTKNQKLFNERLDAIRNYIDDLMKNSPEEFDEKLYLPPASELILNENFRKLFEFLAKEHSHIIRQFKTKVLEDYQSEIIKLITLSYYLLDRVAMTFVSVKDERYAFDIFEALNTTGESLTAIETFKPLVIHYEDKKKDTRTGFIGSQTEIYFNNIENHIYKEKDSRLQQKKSSDLVIALALYTIGKKQPAHLSSQRRFLRNSYEATPSTTKSRQRFIKLLHDIADYKERFWDKDSVFDFLNFGDQTQICYCCLSLIREMDTSMAIPILTRCWVESYNSRDDNNYCLFVSAVKAITAFIVLRRSATGDTANIDGDFRALMQRGHFRKDLESYPFKAGLGECSNELPNINDLCVCLRSYLAQKKLRIDCKDDWINRMIRQPLKNYSNALCRFLLFASAQYSKENQHKPYILDPAKTEPALEYLSYDRWNHEDFLSLEHIAPESNEGRYWQDEIYHEPNFVHTIGNLALLPSGANSAIGNANQQQKWLIYQALSSNDENEAEKYIEQADMSGKPFSNRLKEIIRNHNRVPGVSGIGKAQDWTVNTIEERSKNIGERVWQNISHWLDF